MIAIAFLMVNTPAPQKREYHKVYGTTLKNTSYYRTPVTAPIAFFVMRCKKSLKLFQKGFKDSSSKYKEKGLHPH
jgi:hypothetical protein